MPSRIARALLTAAAALAVAVAPLAPAQAIVGGGPASIGSSPWEVIIIVNKNSLCGGALVSPTVVVTAAHCFNATRDIRNVTVNAGITHINELSAGNQLRLASLNVHPGYDQSTYANDIAVITLADPVVQNENVGLIALPKGLDPASWPAPGTPAKIAGWGATDISSKKASDQFNAAMVQVLASPGAACGAYGDAQPPNIICAGQPGGGVDTCQGDSGSPLVVDVAGIPTLAGVTSSGAECASADYPGVYTSIPMFLSWVSQFVPPIAPTASLHTTGKGSLTASWTFADPATFTATFTSAGRPTLSCTGTGSNCSVSGAVRGVDYVATVTANGQPVGTSGPAKTADGTGPAGKTLSATQVKAISGVKPTKLAVAGPSRGVCQAKGTSLRLLKAGTCTVTVSGKGARALATIAVV